MIKPMDVPYPDRWEKMGMADPDKLLQALIRKEDTEEDENEKEDEEISYPPPTEDEISFYGNQTHE